jgi:hypothetical protein
MTENTNPEMLNTPEEKMELNAEKNNLIPTEELTQPVVEVEPSPKDQFVLNSISTDIAEEHEEELVDFNVMSKEDLFSYALQMMMEKSADAVYKILRNIKPAFDALLEQEMQDALNKYIEEGGNKEEFEYKANDELKGEFARLMKSVKQKRDDEKARQDADREANMQKKHDILEQIKKLIDEDEQADSFNKFKDLQSQFKAIRNIPREKNEEIWSTFKIYEHRFFDRLSINNELKDLDRRKNLGSKIELIEKVSKLMEDLSSKKVLISLKKYQEEWRSIGPVPQEANEDIWNRFKAECDKVFEAIRAIQIENEKVREENLLKKKELLAKALELSNFNSTKTKEWVSQTTIANELMDKWKEVGMVPLKFKESLWEEFRAARNEFFNKKNIFFKQLNAERNKFLQVKNDLCEKAESIANNPIDWMRQTEEIKQIQEQWKKSGPVHEKISEVIWKRFRSACDSFFEKKALHYASQVEEQKQNLEVKKSLIAKLEALLAAEQQNDLINELKSIQEEWNSAGFVPMSEKEKVNKRYSELNDQVFSKFKEASSAIRDMKEKTQWEALLNSPNGLQKIKREERTLIERIKGLKSDMDTWDNNLGFFGKSNKGENPMIKQVEEKIAIAGKNIKQLEEKLKTLRQFAKQHGGETNA